MADILETHHVLTRTGYTSLLQGVKEYEDKNKDKKQTEVTMIHRYIATFVYTARVPIYAEDEYEAEDMADEVPEDRYIDNLTFDHIDIEEE